MRMRLRERLRERLRDPDWPRLALGLILGLAAAVVWWTRCRKGK